MGSIKKDKTIARLKNTHLVKRDGVYINFLLEEENTSKSEPEYDVMVAIRVSKSCGNAVKRNKIKRWVREALRAWIAETEIEKRLFLLINIGIKDRETDFREIKGIIYDLLGQIFKERGSEYYKTL